jgi:hypothetical protein
VLHNFNNKDGAMPEAGLIFDAAGNLYGTTYVVAITRLAAYTLGTISVISQRCGGSNAEVEQATDVVNGKCVYEAWIGCGGIGFARSTDGGKTFSGRRHCPDQRVRGIQQ